MIIIPKILEKQVFFSQNQIINSKFKFFVSFFHVNAFLG